MTQRKVLLVDYDPAYLTLGSEELGARGYEVTEAHDGAEALEKLKHETFDIVISDLEMPVPTGLDLLDGIRKDGRENVAALPFVMLTERGDIGSVGRAYESGATSFVQKPVNWPTLVHHVEFVLRASEQAAALRIARDDAKKALNSKNAVLMALRHELRSPLHVIQGFTDILCDKLDRSLDDQSRMEFSFIHDGVDDMIDKIDKLFLHADILNGERILQTSQTLLANVVMQAVDRVRKMAEASEIAFDIAYDDGVEDRVMHVDENMLSVAIGHVLGNAIKFGPDGGTVRIASRAAGEEIEIAVEDEGEGFDLDRIDTYLEGFGQSDDGLTRTSSGLGLGLTLANNLTLAHKGLLTLSNSARGGGVATIRLHPLATRRVEKAASAERTGTG